MSDYMQTVSVDLELLDDIDRSEGFPRMAIFSPCVGRGGAGASLGILPTVVVAAAPAVGTQRG